MVCWLGGGLCVEIGKCFKGRCAGGDFDGLRIVLSKASLWREVARGARRKEAAWLMA